jgi:hypothetical protein
VSGEFETEGGVKPNDLAAMQTNPSSPDWILGKVISHDPVTGMYMLADEDVESNKGELVEEANRNGACVLPYLKHVFITGSLSLA